MRGQSQIDQDQISGQIVLDFISMKWVISKITNVILKKRPATAKVKHRDCAVKNWKKEGKWKKEGTGGRSASFLVGIWYKKGLVMCTQYFGDPNGESFAKILKNNFLKVLGTVSTPKTNHFYRREIQFKIAKNLTVHLMWFTYILGFKLIPTFLFWK